MDDLLTQEEIYELVTALLAIWQMIEQVLVAVAGVQSRMCREATHTGCNSGLLLHAEVGWTPPLDTD